MPDVTQRNFAGGEVSPAIGARADLTKYATGLALCENFFVRAQGGVYSRPGTKFICEQDSHANRGRLIRFQFSSEQTYVLLFEAFKIRFIKQGELVLQGGGPTVYEVATPWNWGQLRRLQFTQKNDVMTIVHPGFDPRELKRFADDNWTLTTINFEPTLPPPEWEFNESVDISGITQSTSCTVTSAANFFTEIGDIIRIQNVGGMTELNDKNFRVIAAPTGSSIVLGDIDSNLPVDSTGFGAYTSGGQVILSVLSNQGAGFGDHDKTYRYVVTAVDEDGVESLPGLSASILSKSLSTTGGVRLRWLPVTGADYYRVYKDPSNATNVYGWIGDSRNTEFVDFNIAPITSDAPPRDSIPFTGSGNRPATVNYYQQRLIFANTNQNPQVFFASQTGIYNSMRSSQPARPTDAITFRIDSKEVNEIRHLIEMDALIILTSGSEHRVTEGQDEVLTPASIGARKQSNNGASWVMPAVVDDTIIYVQDKGSRIRDMNYEFVDDRFRGNDLSIMAEHLFEERQVVEMSFAQEPYGILWCVCDDGTLLGLTYQRHHQVWAWHHHHTATNAGDSRFESVTTVSEDGRDATYVIVRRVVNGQVRRYVERFEKRDVTSSENVWTLDCALRYTGSPATVFSNLNHLEGETVWAVTDGNVVESLTVTGGSVTIPEAGSNVLIGLPFTPAIETLDLDVNSPKETLKAQQVSVSKVTVEIQQSRGMWIGPKKDSGGTGTMTEVKPRFQTDGYDAIKLRTAKEEVVIAPTWEKTGGIRIEQRSPMPLAILSITPTVDVS